MRTRGRPYIVQRLLVLWTSYGLFVWQFSNISHLKKLQYRIFKINGGRYLALIWNLTVNKLLNLKNEVFITKRINGFCRLFLTHKKKNSLLPSKNDNSFYSWKETTFHNNSFFARCKVLTDVRTLKFPNFFVSFCGYW